MDTLGIEPRASRMLSGCDTTTPRALGGPQCKSRGWQLLQLKLVNLGELERIDQCSFDLRGPLGGLHLKPTGFWSTNPKFIAEFRSGDYRCAGDHEYEQVLA